MFDIRKDSEIYFYGYSQFDLVKDKYNAMSLEGYKVKGFIDKRAQEMRKTLPCWLMEEFINDNRGNENTVIIFLLQNALQHEEIAYSLLEKGFKKMLFIPLDMDTEEKRKMYELYNAFLGGEYKNLNNIPESDLVLTDGSVCRETAKIWGKWLTYFVPAELLFSYGETRMYGNENIRFCFPYRELYDYLLGKRKACMHYLRFMGKAESGEFLRDRQKLFLFFEYQRNLGMDYFVEAAAYVKWNDNGYFNIIDGHHRAAYLAYMGYVYIPVRMEQNDFLLWENKNEAAEISNLCELPCPIPLPGFLERKSNFESRWRRVTEFIYLKLRVWERRKICFAEADMNLGFYARFFQRANKMKSYIVMEEKGQIKVCQALNRMLKQEIEICGTLEIRNTEVHAAYIDADFSKEGWAEQLIHSSGFLCLVFEVTEKYEKQYLDRIQAAMGSLAEYICQYQSKEIKKIYGITRGEICNG